VITIAIGISNAMNIDIAIFLTELTNAIDVIYRDLPTTFHLLHLPFFVIAIIKALFTSLSASLARLYHSVQLSPSLLSTMSQGSPSSIECNGS
jgi:hypothetical protein